MWVILQNKLVGWLVLTGCWGEGRLSLTVERISQESGRDHGSEDCQGNLDDWRDKNKTQSEQSRQHKLEIFYHLNR